MIDQGIWILAIMVYGARHEVTLVPYEQFPNYQVCRAWLEKESIEKKLPMTCTKMQKDEL